MGGMVTIFDPNGNMGSVPQANLAAAVKAGGKLAVTVKAPDGSTGEIPSDRLPDAAKAGASVVPFEQQENQHPGFWQNLWSDVKNMVPGAVNLDQPTNKFASNEHSQQQFNAEDTARQAAGYSLPYRALAPAAEGIGVNVPGMEQSAKEGDEAGVYGHAAAVPTVMAATAGIAKGAGALSDTEAFTRVKNAVENVTPKQVAQTIGGTSGAVAGHGTLSAPGAYYGAKTAGNIAEGLLGKERANTPLRPAPTNAGAPLPETPAAELLQAQPLAQGGAAPAPEPAAALGKVPIQPTYPGAAFPEHPGTFPGAPEPTMPPEARLPEAFQPPKPKPPEVPGTADQPFKSLMELPGQAVNQALQELGPQAPIAALTERANNIAKLGQLLNEGLGGKGLEPNVPIGKQGSVAPGAAGSMVKSVELPEGHTPLDSSALKSFAYDPKAQELDVTTNGYDGKSGRYIYSDVSPDQAEALSKGQFMGKKPDEPPSVGRAWADIRKSGSVMTKKLVNGKLESVKKTLSDADQVSPEEWEAAEHIGTQVEGSPIR